MIRMHPVDAIEDYFELNGIASELLYKDNVDSGEATDVALWDSYETEYYLDPDDPSKAVISWSGGEFFIGSPAYLLVKDGNATPAWYFFNLTDSGLNWDGKETITLVNFWPDQGAISNVDLYGTNTPVPEPATMLLFGTGLAGLAAVARRRKN